MLPTRASRLSDVPAIMRAIHQASDGEPKILSDPIAPRLVNLAALDANWLAPILNHPFAPQWRAGFLIRSRYAEDCLAEGVARGLGQYLILGAGLDTFAYRQPVWFTRLGRALQRGSRKLQNEAFTAAAASASDRLARSRIA